MKPTKEEARTMLLALKILESGETLLGLDIDKKVVSKLIGEVSANLSKRTASTVARRVKELIEEAEGSCLEGSEEDSSFDDDEGFRDYGPSYSYADTTKIIEKAIKGGKKLQMEYYTASRGEFTKRKVEPEAIEGKGGTPYLHAYCLLRKGDRVFRLSRIKNIKVVDK